MTLEEALTLRDGDYVTSRHTMPPGRLLRIAEVWVNDARTIVCVRIVEIAGNAWLDATGYTLARRGTPKTPARPVADGPAAAPAAAPVKCRAKKPPAVDPRQIDLVDLLGVGEAQSPEAPATASKATRRANELAAGQAAAERAADAREATVPLLVQLMKQLAFDRGAVTVADLREAAVREKILTGDEEGRELSYLGTIAKRAGLVPTGEWVRSHLTGSHANLHQSWELPRSMRAEMVAARDQAAA